MEFVSADPVLAVHDLEQAARWFRKVLGCTITEPDPGNWIFCTAGPVTFRLGRCPDALPASELGDHSYLAYLTVVGVDDYHRRALAERAEVIKPPRTEPWGRREMALRSPEGHRFMLSEPARAGSGG
ncbi:VOC family protein [Mycobacterium sp. 4858]|uniref:VOC family protein n=1 Tax=Mycobacterium sp. 4858 TaxID=2057185 RepID=UPI000C865FBB|nr:VOC family protein [Mycobacterium sp. 4858]